MKLKKGDRVRVLTGKDVGKEGEITRVLVERNRVIVDGVNVAKRHQRATKATMQGGIIDKAPPRATRTPPSAATVNSSSGNVIASRATGR